MHRRAIGCSRARARNVTDGEVIFRQGAPADSLLLIAAGPGTVRVGAEGAREKQLMVEVFRAGDVFGELGALDGAPRTAEAVAQGSLRLLVLPGATFRAALVDIPLLGRNLSLILAARVRRTFTLLQDATFETLEVRLARQVLYLARRDGRAGPQGLQLGQRANQEDLADPMGATTGSVITILNGWHARGLARYDPRTGRLTLAAPEALAALIGGAGDAPTG